MNEGRGTSHVVTLDAPRALPGGLSTEEFASLRAIKKRKRLEASAIYRARAHAIRDLTSALGYHRPARPAPRPAGEFLRVICWNIERGKRLDGIKAYLTHHRAIREADVMLLNEADVGMARSGNRNVPVELAEALGFEAVFGSCYVCLSHGNSRDGEPNGENQLGLHGNAILSRFPIRRAENFWVTITHDVFHSSEKRLGCKKALWAELDTPLGRFPVAAVHLDTEASMAQRGAQLRDVLMQLETRGVAERALIGGDFNSTTYDLKSIPRLVWNLVSKLLRGGFPHALYHYLHPYELYERPVFEELRAHGFDYRSFNAMGVGTTRYEVDTFEGASMVRDYLPQVAVDFLRWNLRPWNGVAPLKLDWFAGRGVWALVSGERREASGRESLSPTPFEKPSWNGRLLSDHDPILVDVVW